MNNKGFALLEVLIAMMILSVILLNVLSAVSTGIKAISLVKSNTIAVLIAKNELNDFILSSMRGTDLKDETIEEYPGFKFSRETTKLDLGLGPFELKKTLISVNWTERGKERTYDLTFLHESR